MKKVHISVGNTLAKKIDVLRAVDRKLFNEEAAASLDEISTKLSKKHGIAIDTEAKICPKCNSPLTKRSGRKGEFYGCSKYPKCVHTEQI